MTERPGEGLSLAVTDVPWTLSGPLTIDLALLDATIRMARAAQAAGDNAEARAGAERVLGRTAELRIDDPVGDAELERLRISAFVIVARALGATASDGASTVAFRRVVDTYLAQRKATLTARGDDAGGEAERGVMRRALDFSVQLASQYQRRRAAAAAALHELAEVLVDALRIAPGDPVILDALADLLARQGRKPEAATRLRERAQGLASSGHYGAAIAALDIALELAPGSVETRLGRADVLRLAGRTADCRAAIRPLLDSSPADARAITIEGLALLQDGDAPAAQELLAAAVKLADDQAWVYGNLGLALQELGRHEDAVNALDRAIELDGRRPIRLLQKAVVLSEAGRLEEALRLVDEVTTTAPDLVAALRLRADVLRRQGELDGALMVVEQALARDPRSPALLATKGQVLRARRDLTGAEAALAAAAELDSQLLGVLVELGEVRADLGRVSEAADAFDRALALDPSCFRALSGKADIERRRGELDAAQQTLDQVLSVAPESAEALTNEGRLLYERQDFAGAAERLWHAVKADDGYADAHAWLGEVLRLQGYRDEALQQLDRALELDPGNVFALATRGQVLIETRRVGAGVEALREAVAAAPDVLWAREALADGLRTQGEYAAALEHFLYLDARLPQNTILRLKIADVYAADERYDEAFAIVDEILAADADSFDALVRKAVIELDIANFDSAAALLGQALALQEDSWALFLRGWAKRNLGPEQLDAARADYERAIALNATSPEYRQKLAEVVALTEGREAARPLYQAVLDELDIPAEGADPFDIQMRGWAHMGLGQYDRAARSLRRALKAIPKDVPTRFDLALAMLASGRTSLADREYGEALMLAERASELSRRRILHIARRELNEALTLLERNPGGLDEEACEHVKATASRVDAELLSAMAALEPRIAG